MRFPTAGVWPFCVGLVHCSRDLQVQISVNFSLKLGSMALFTHLKIILLQCFQFSVISDIQTDPYYLLQEIDLVVPKVL